MGVFVATTATMNTGRRSVRRSVRSVVIALPEDILREVLRFLHGRGRQQREARLQFRVAMRQWKQL